MNYRILILPFFFMGVLAAFPVKVWSAVPEITAGFNYTVALQSDGTLWAWGKNGTGQLGDGTTADRDTPTQIGSATDWTSIAAGKFHTMALKSGGTLWAWGMNNYGQLGDGTTSIRFSPTQIGSASDWVSIAVGLYHTIALKSDGTLWAWGMNYYYQLGDGTTADKNSPAQIGSAINWASIAAGVYHTIALKSDGTLWAWGRNNYYQLGDGTTINRNSPTQIGSATDWASIVSGTYHTIALKSDGTLWSWGRNNYGQLGDGTTANRNSPAQIGSAVDWDSIAAGDGHSMVIKSNGTMWAWGWNWFGQLGDGTTANRNSPAQIGSAVYWDSIAAGGYHSIARKSDGTLWSWGANIYGQLGDGTQTDKHSPVFIVYLVLNAEAGGAYVGVEGQAINLDGSGSSVSYLYEWDIDNNGIYDYSSSLPIQSHTYSQQGTYTIKLRVTDDVGATDEATTSAIISDTSPAADFVGTPTSGSSPLTVNFTNNTTGYDQPLTYEWDFDNNGTADSTFLNPSYPYSTPGIYSVKLTATDTDSSVNTLTRINYITVCNLPVRTTSGSTTYYSTFQTAYDAAIDGDTIQFRNLTFTENVSLNRNISVSLQGGYNCDYSLNTDKTTLDGMITVSNGTAIVEDFVIE